jgi:hypothetical protein
MLNMDLEISYINTKTPLVGSDLLVENFISNFKETIQLYTTSSFIRSCMDENIGF